MKRPLCLVALLPLFAGCQQAVMAKRAADAVLARSVRAYCRLPEPVRMANRERIAAKIFPHRIEIHCNQPFGRGG